MGKLFATFAVSALLVIFTMPSQAFQLRIERSLESAPNVPRVGTEGYLWLDRYRGGRVGMNGYCWRNSGAMCDIR